MADSKLALGDDGTLDTLVICLNCDAEIRYSEALRDEATGRITDEFWEMAHAQHRE